VSKLHVFYLSKISIVQDQKIIFLGQNFVGVTKPNNNSKETQQENKEQKERRALMHLHQMCRESALNALSAEEFLT